MRMESIFKPHDTVYERFPNIPPPGGLRMLRQITSAYAVPGFIDTNVNWWDEHGNPMVQPHPENIRHQDNVVEDYESSIVELGVCAASRSKPMAVMSDTPTGRPYLLITWGTMSRAFYNVASAPATKSNPQVLASIEQGIPSLTVLHSKTPRDCFEWQLAHVGFHVGQVSRNAGLQLRGDGLS